MYVFMNVLFAFLIVWAIGLVVLIGYGIYCGCVNLKYKFINWNLKRKGHALNEVKYYEIKY